MEKTSAHPLLLYFDNESNVQWSFLFWRILTENNVRNRPG